MKWVYIAIGSAIIITIGVLVLTFFYLDQQRHHTFSYALHYDDGLYGYETVDRYKLENRVIYKSVSELPYEMLDRKIVRKISFGGRGKKFINYTKEVSPDSAQILSYILSDSQKISFLKTVGADFYYLDSLPTYGNDIPYEYFSLATYPPLIRRYNFKRRGEQFVNVLKFISPSMPPARDMVSIISIGKDAIDIGTRRIACEQLVLELKNGLLISVWVTRTFHNVLMVKIPQYGFKAIFCTEKKDIAAEEYNRKSDMYTERDVTFENEEIILEGTFSVPRVGEMPYPSVLLIWDSGPLDRNAHGMFTDIAHILSEAGYCTLRFDKRGIGQSQGFFSTYAQAEVISDIKSALAFLKTQPEVDRSRIALLGHSEGGFYASYMAGIDKDVMACIIMSGISSFNRLKKDSDRLRDAIQKHVPLDAEYLERAINAFREERKIIQDKSDWITILGKRVFTKKMVMQDKYDPIETIKKVKAPVMILHGKKDDINSVEEAGELSNALAEAGNNNFTTVYFGDLGYYFGPVVKKPPLREHVEIDMEVLESMILWLDKNTAVQSEEISQVEGDVTKELEGIPAEDIEREGL